MRSRNDGVEIRAELADAPAGRVLFDEYMALVRERLGPHFVPPARIFATEDAFAPPAGAFLVLYDAGEAVACGGLRGLTDDVAVIKRMFVTSRGRRRGHGRRLLRELEGIAAARRYQWVRLLTTGVLAEARALYLADGYSVVETVRDGDRTDFWLEKALDGAAEHARRRGDSGGCGGK